MRAFVSRVAEQGRLSTPMSVVLLRMLKLWVGCRVLADLVLQQQDVIHGLAQDCCFRVCILGASICGKRKADEPKRKSQSQAFGFFFVLRRQKTQSIKIWRPFC